MRALLEHLAIVCESTCHLLLRAVGRSGKHPYTVIVRGQPLWWRDGDGNVAGNGGFYSTRVVMAGSQREAEASAIHLVRDAVSAIARNPKESPVTFAIEECARMEGIAWRQFRGFSFWEDGQR